MPHGSQAPEDHGQRVSQPCTQPVNDPAHQQHADRISPLERQHQIAEVNVVPSQIVLQWALEDSQDLSVHIVFRGSEKQEGADNPAEVAGPWRRLGFHRY